MVGSLFFVHGTGNWDGRRPGSQGELDRTVADIRAALGPSGLGGVRVVAPPWAKTCAPDWPDIRLALPPAVVTRAVAGAEALDDTAGWALWELLLMDPLLELRLAGLAEPAEVPMVPGAAVPEAEVVELVRSTAPDGRLLAQQNVDPALFTAAINVVAESTELGAAARAAGLVSPDLLDATARAVVATLLAEWRTSPQAARGEPSPRAAVRAESRDALVDLTRAALAEGTYRGLVPDVVRRALMATATRVGTAWAAPRRGTWMDPVTAFTADIAFYLRHGDEVRTYLRDQLAGAPRPVVALGHSLGGVALVDLLASADPPDVALLVTVGSQAPYLFLLDALANLRPAGPRPRPFSPWLNVYDRRDFLAFCAQRVFPQPDVTDVVVDAGVPFPESHSAYWQVPETWAAVAEAWPR